MRANSTTQGWSTLTLFSVGAALGLLGYLTGLRKHPAAISETKEHISAPICKTTGAPEPAANSHSPPVSGDERSHPADESAPGMRSPASEKDRASWIEKLAASDHRQALALASAEPNWRLRTLLRNAALRGWASAEPAAAAQFALTLPEHERREAVAAIFLGASHQPETAATLAEKLCAQDPALAEDHGRALIDALAEVGAFPVLTRFAATEASSRSAEWLRATFGKWAERQPAAALQAFDSLPSTAAREAAFQGLVLGWSMADPRELAAYAATLPTGENRSLAMQQALTQWMNHDVESAAKWVMRFDPGPEFDLSASTVATNPKLIVQQPAVALGWAQSILEPALRETTLTTLARQWAGSDRGAARRLIEQTTGLSAEDRRVLLAGVDAPAMAEY